MKTKEKVSKYSYVSNLLKKMWECENQSTAGRFNLRGVIVIAVVQIVNTTMSRITIIASTIADILSNIFLKVNSNLPNLLIPNVTHMFILLVAVFLICMLYVLMCDYIIKKMDSEKQENN